MIAALLYIQVNLELHLLLFKYNWAQRCLLGMIFDKLYILGGLDWIVNMFLYVEATFAWLACHLNSIVLY